MKLDKTKILEAETKLNTLLKELVNLTASSSSEQPLTANQLLKLVQVARVSAESLLLLGIGLPTSDSPFGSCRDRED